MASFIPGALYNSNICRICGIDGTDGIHLYDENNETDFKIVINRYLPIKVEDDGKLPRIICPDCYGYLVSVTQFFNLMVKGQARLRYLYNQECELKKKIKINRIIPSSDENKPPFSDSTSESLALADNPFYSDDHEFSLLVEGIVKPKKRRGRPRKSASEGNAVCNSPSHAEGEHSQNPNKEEVGKCLPSHFISSCSEQLGKRIRKPPQRLMETVAGNELDKILLAEGAIDESETDAVQKENDSSRQFHKADDQESQPVEVIGHLQTPDGRIAEPILSQSHGRGSSRRKKNWSCHFCQQTFSDKTKWIVHRRSHEGLNMQCGGPLCLEIFNNKNKFVAHQMATKHSGMHIVNIEIGPTENVDDEKTDVFEESQEAAQKIETIDSEMNLEGEDCGLHEHGGADGATTIKMVMPDYSDNADDEEPVATSSTSRNKLTGKFECNVCKRTFNHSSSLVYHKESCHNNGFRFACSKCSKSFSHRQLLQRHQMVHSDIRPFSCTKCGVGFKSKSNLYNHQVVHSGEKKFTCSICGHKFGHKTSLNLHAVLHQGIRPYKCPECPKSFSQNGNLSEHLRIHYGSKPYSCDHCGKAFTTSSQFKLHVKRHTGEKPWKCQYCDKQFLHKDTYITHERRHTGEKPFICQLCPRAFAEQWSLKKHTRLHTGEKPYKCQHCGKTFADCSNLTKHKKVHGIVTNAQSEVFQEQGVNSAENLNGVIYVINQENDQQYKQEKEDNTEEMSGQWTTLINEHGEELIIPLPDGRTFQIVSIDMDTNEVQIRIAEGVFLIQLAEPPNILDESFTVQIRDIVLGMKLPTPDEARLDVENTSEFHNCDSSLNYMDKMQEAESSIAIQTPRILQQSDKFPVAEENVFSSALGKMPVEELKSIYLVG